MLNIERIFRLLLIVLLLATIVACSNNPTTSGKKSDDTLVKSASQAFKDISDLKNFRANISSSTTAVGKQESTSKSLDSFLDYVLVKVEQGSSQTEPVTFTANTDSQINGKKIRAGNTISQEDLSCRVDKVYVIGDYTLVSFITVDVLALINGKDTTVQSDAYSTRYNGSLNFETRDASDQKGEMEDIFFEYTVPNSKDDEERIYIFYTKTKWWVDGTGKQNEERIDLDDTLVLRCPQNNNPALNEYNGVAIYDTFDYYTSDFRSSFIIDNNTGYIYAIPKTNGENQINLSVQQGVVIDKNLGPVKLSIDGNGNLKLEQILANKNIYIDSTFKDSYDQYYVFTDSLSEKDGNVIFFNTCGEYIPTKDGRVLHIVYDNTVSVDSKWAYKISGLYYVGKNFEETPVNAQDTVLINYMTYIPESYNPSMYSPRSLYEYNRKNGFDYWNMNNKTLSSGAKASFHKIENGKLYFQGLNGGNIAASEYDLTNGDYLFQRLYAGEDGYKYALLDGKYCILAKKQSNNLYMLLQIDSSETILKEWKKIIIHSDGTKETSESITKFVWNYAYENGMAVEYDPNATGEYANIQDLYIYKTEYYEVKVDGKTTKVIFTDGYTFDAVIDAYNQLYNPSTPLLTDVSVSDWIGYENAFNMTFNVVSKNGTDSYRIVKTSEDQYSAVLASSSLVETTTLTLQPINR